MDSDAERGQREKEGKYFYVLLCYFSKAYSTHLVFYHLRSWNSLPYQTVDGYSWELLVGMCRAILQILTLFQTKKCHFPHSFSHPEVVAKRNITSLHKTEIMSSLQQKYCVKSISNSHITLSFRVAKIYFVFTQTACLVFALKPCDISHTVSVALTL